MTRRRVVAGAMRLLALAVAATLLPGAVARQAPDPIVVLVSFDGWRWDYTDRAQVPHVRELAGRGVRARGLIPAFPASTFPNHYTIVTGLYPEHHGIIANTIRDPGFPERFTMTSATAKDGRWWGGEPIWVTAIRQGRRASAMFWPGSEAPIGGIRPTAWLPFNDNMPNSARVQQVLDWLALPARERPSLVTLYFSDVDTVGHSAGPESQAVLDAAARVDAELGRLMTGVHALGLDDRVTYVVVSDHGMAPLDRSRVIVLDDYLDLSTVDVVDWSPVLELVPRSGSFDDIYRALAGKHPAMKVYRKADVPAHLHFRNNPRITDVVAIADPGWLIASRARLLGWRVAGFPGGGHGFDPTDRSMHALFVAAGPRIKPGQWADPFENIHIYNLLCRLLGLTPAANDGDDRLATRYLR